MTMEWQRYNELVEGICAPLYPIWGTLEGRVAAAGRQPNESVGDVEVLSDLASGQGSAGALSSQSTKSDNGMECGRIAAVDFR